MANNTGSPLASHGLLPEGLRRPPKILVVDEDPGIYKLLGPHLRGAGCVVGTARDRATALSMVKRMEGVDLALLELGLGGGSGLEALRSLNATGQVGYVIVMTASGTMTDAVAALQEGAYDFVIRSDSLDDMRLAIRNALHALDLRDQVERLRLRLAEQERSFSGVVGTSDPFRRMMKLVRKATASNITVLILGESGTGKELIARAIHFEGQLRNQPFVAINCAAIPETLLESELFGHEKGAFTGATARHVGKFEEAHEGTLFLDEIGELSPALQAKLLRVLQTQEVQPIGGRIRRVKVRVLSATNQNLLQAMEAGRFRRDLYYRLAVFPIELPPLRERREDIPALVDHFIERFRVQEGKHIHGLAPEALDRLVASPWYGNVRELENVIYRAVVLAEAPVLGLHDFPSLPPAAVQAVPAVQAVQIAQAAQAAPGQASPPDRSTADAPPVGTPTRQAGATLEQLEARAIAQALEANSGNMTRAALQLNIGRATLYRKSRKYGISRT